MYYTGLKFPGNLVSLYLCIISGIIGVIELQDIVVKTIYLNKGLTSKEMFYILDLCFLFPAFIISAFINSKKNHFGFFLIGVFLIKTIALMPALLLSDSIYYVNEGKFIDLTFDLIACLILISAVLLYYSYQKNNR